MRRRSWSVNQLKKASVSSTSVRQVLSKIGLQPTGGNYLQLQKYFHDYNIDISHFTGKTWNKGKTGIGKIRIPLNKILLQNSDFQSYKLKNRLFIAGLKKPKCEICGWEKHSNDGRIPVELDHINGNSRDNRIENLRILCPNCHSLQLTHRGKNKQLLVRWRNRYTRST